MPNFKLLRKHWPIHKRKFWTGVFSLLFMVLLPLRISHACGGGEIIFSGYSFLHSDIVEEDIYYNPFFLKFENLYQNLPGQDSIQYKSNLQEWSERFCDVYKTTEIEQVVYETSVEEMRVLKTAASSEKIKVPSRLYDNPFAIHLKQKKCLEVIDYLIFAKRCQPHVTRGNGWDTPTKNPVAMENLIEEGLRVFKKTKSHYVKLRYAYQLVRLAHYSKNYERTLELYDYLLPKIDNDPSILEDWILGHKAGALMAMGKNVEASYLYALIFQRCPSKRESAYQSFKIKTDQEWHQCQLLCGDDPERATLYALRAHAEDAKATEEMDTIYSLDPHNVNLELLLVREIRKLEKDFLGLEFNDEKRDNKRYFDLPRQEARNYLQQLQKLVNKCVQEKKVKRPVLWQMANAYLVLLDGDPIAAQDSFARLDKKIVVGPLRKQLDALQLALKIYQVDYMSPKNEELIYELIHREPYYRENRYLPDFINDRMAYLYKRDGHPGFAYRCQYTIDELKPNPQMEILDDLLDGGADTTHHNGLFDAFMIDAAGNNIRSGLLDMKATKMMAQGNLEAAKEVYRLIPRAEWNKYQLNPFRDELLDCVECPTEDTVVYNKVELIEKLFELEYKAKSDMEFGAYYFYQLGLAHYNMSYYGNSWEAMDFFRSGANWDYDKDGIFPSWSSPYGNQENRDLSLAMAYFENARTLAHDLELGAKAAFMAARCEQKNYFRSKDCKYNPYKDEIPQPPADYQFYFSLLKKDYSKTELYQELIEECKFFAAYARN